MITLDSDSPKSQRLMFIGTNNYQAGITGGQALVKRMKGKGLPLPVNILLNGPPCESLLTAHRTNRRLG